MKIYSTLKSVITYIAEGVLELFSPNHDNYPPLVGAQPYSGEIYSRKQRHKYARTH